MPTTPPEPVVSMLWERTDAPTALRRRFGFPDGATAAAHLQAALGRHWGLRATTCRRMTMSDQNLLAWMDTPAGRVVVKACAWAPLFDRLGVIGEVVTALGDQGLPVAAPVRSTAGAARALLDGPVPLSVAVLPEVDGELLDSTDPGAVRATGEVLARVHRAMAGLDLELPPLAGGGAVHPFAAPEAATARTRGRAPGAAARLDALLRDLPELDVPAALVHGDVRGANVLVSGGRVSALLDHDSLVVGHRVQDLAAAAVKLATRFHDWDPPPPGSRDQLLDGYRSVAALTAAEEHWLEVCVLAEGLGQIPAGPDPAGWAAAVERGL
ncbi:Phosphotransferase enzyme family protein [Klenkia soli]|uniref:Phosphotransferase enzyme family protein n=1 Tax=Klenkia soli TaxID=1052260 RepID=A0A1H0L285_9ACTN|nr:phosphotransferase [Klenkia soli]SDO62404.1 Phosphotransferase enzyme family protein [Klenkia soli]